MDISTDLSSNLVTVSLWAIGVQMNFYIPIEVNFCLVNRLNILL